MSGRRKRQRDTIATVPLPPKVLRQPKGSIEGGAAVALEDADAIPSKVKRGSSKPRPTIHATVVPPPVSRRVKRRPSLQATQAVPAVPDSLEEEPTNPVDVEQSSLQTQAVSTLSDQVSTGKRPKRPANLTVAVDSAAKHSERRASAGHTIAAKAVDEVDEVDEVDGVDEVDIDLEESAAGVVPLRAFKNTDRFTQPLALTRRRPAWWTLAAAAALVAAAAVVAVLQLAG